MKRLTKIYIHKNKFAFFEIYAILYIGSRKKNGCILSVEIYKSIKEKRLKCYTERNRTKTKVSKVVK